jgi:nucleotide-binding universal stress UspA family protein
MVGFSSPKRSAKTVETAALHAKALGAELIILRMVPDPEKMGVVAQLIATERPGEKAKLQVEECAKSLQEQGINSRGVVRMGQVTSGIIEAALEEKVDLLFVGTANIAKRPFFLMEKDPIVHYLVNRCPIPLVLVRNEFSDQTDVADEAN